MQEEFEHQNVGLKLQIVNVEGECDQTEQHHEQCGSKRFNFVTSETALDASPRQESIDDQHGLLEVERLFR